MSLGARAANYFVSEDVSTNSPNGVYEGILFNFRDYKILLGYKREVAIRSVLQLI